MVFRFNYFRSDKKLRLDSQYNGFYDVFFPETWKSECINSFLFVRQKLENIWHDPRLVLAAQTLKNTHSNLFSYILNYLSIKNKTYKITSDFNDKKGKKNRRKKVKVITK